MNALIISIVLSVGLGSLGYALMVACSLQEAVNELRKNEGGEADA